MCASASLVLQKIACLCAVLIPPAFYYVHLSVLFFYVIVSLDATIIITVHTGHKVSHKNYNDPVLAIKFSI